MYGLPAEDELLCFSFNRAVITFANALKEEVRRVTKDAKNDKAAEQQMKKTMRKWLNSASGNTRGQFRDPFASGKVQKRT